MGQQTDGTEPSEDAVKLAGQRQQNQVIWYNGDTKKTRANGFDLNVLNLYLELYQTERLLTSSTDGKRQTGKNKEKSQNRCQIQVRTREVPVRLSTATRNFAIHLPQKNPFEI